MKISYRSLPEESFERLHKIVRFGDTETYVISQAKQTIAQAAVAVGILTIALVTYATEAMRWSTPERIFYRIVLSVALPAVVFGAIYLASWARCRLKPCVIITPRYVLRTHPTWVEVLETRDLRGAHSWRVWETYIVQVESAMGRVVFLAPQKIAGHLLKDLEQFPHYIDNLEKRGDQRALDVLQLFSEQQLRSSNSKTPGKLVRIAIVSLSLVCCFYGARFGFAALEAHNEVRADELQWDAVKEHPVSQEFRNYLSSLPNGRHQNEAAAGLNDLYLSAEQRYAEKATDEDGRGTVLALLEHARTTGQYKVVLDFQHKIEFPEHLVDDLKRDHAVKKLEGPERFFSADQNKFRERQVSQTIQASFDGAFGDGLLVFETTPTEPGEPRLAVAYGVTASGVLYYPTEQDAVPKEDRDWIVGVTYLWNVKLGLAKTEANQLAFELESNPAHEFSSRDNGLPYSFEQRYDGMAQSAFEDLGRRLFAKLSIAKVDPKQSPEQK